MDIKFTAFLYSKYSNTCKNFFNLVDNIPPEVKENIKFINVCIDNEKIRKNVLNSKLDIKNVPCILIIYNDGRAEKFEGIDAFKWGNEILIKIEQQKPKPPLQPQFNDPSMQMNGQIQGLPPQQMNGQMQQGLPQQMNGQMQGPPPQQMNVPPSHNVKNIKEQMNIAKMKNGEDEFEEEEEEYEEEEEIPKPKKKKNTKKQTHKLKEKTSVDDLLSYSENENENVIISEETETKEPSKSAISIKKESLMNTAMAMQKAREASDKNLKIPLNGDR